MVLLAKVLIIIERINFNYISIAKSCFNLVLLTADGSSGSYAVQIQN